MWRIYTEIVDRHKPIDILLCNGDMVDGKGTRSGGTEQITSDRDKQVQIAKGCIDYVESPVVCMTFGTSYHTGSDGEDWEAVLAREVKAAKIESHAFYDINGVIIDMKHKVGSSSIPHGRLTALAGQVLWNEIWAIVDKQQPLAKILIRSHDHYYEQIDHMGCIAFITPSLQGMGSKFGARECSGIVDFGMIFFDIYEDGTFTWTCDKVVGEVQRAKALVL
jgi:hypothetical protein